MSKPKTVVGQTENRFNKPSPSIEGDCRTQPVPATAPAMPDDAQAMGLVKKFELSLSKFGPDEPWIVGTAHTGIRGRDHDLNRAVYEYVEKAAP